jgi:hypothetical protein
VLPERDLLQFGGNESSIDGERHPIQRVPVHALVRAGSPWHASCGKGAWEEERDEADCLARRVIWQTEW